MDESEALAKLGTKIERARKQLFDLEIEVKGFLDQQPYKVDTKRDAQTQYLVYYLSSVLQPSPTIAAIAGDILQNLRSALDHLAYHLVSIGTRGKGPFHHVYFPICANESAYRRDKARKIQGMRQDAIQAINAVKPFGGGNDLLWQLHQLNNIDKHRLLITTGSAYRSVNIGPRVIADLNQVMVNTGLADSPKIPAFDLFIKPADRMFPLKKGDELFVDLPDAVVNEQIQFVFEVAFGEPGVLEGAPLFETLRKMIAEVDNIILNFKPLLI